MPCVKEITGRKLLYRAGSSAQCCDDLEGWDGGVGGREIQEGGDICIYIGDSLCCTAETYTAL